MFYDTTIQKAKEYDFVKDPSKPMKKKAPNYSILQCFDCAESGADAYHPDTPRTYFRGIYYKTIDSIVSVVETRFNQPSYHTYDIMVNLFLKMVNKENTSVEQDFMKTTFADDIDTAQVQIESDVLPVMFQNEKAECFDDIITQIKKLTRHQLLFIPNIIKIRHHSYRRKIVFNYYTYEFNKYQFISYFART